jgi:hypothetical protein
MHPGETYFFKIDYYLQDMRGGSEDPADPGKTVRVLTIMRADDTDPFFLGSFVLAQRSDDLGLNLPRAQCDTELRRLLIRRSYASLQRARDHSCFLFLAGESLERTNVLFRPRLKLRLFCHSSFSESLK